MGRKESSQTKQCFYNKKMHEVDIDSNQSEDESEHPFFVGVITKFTQLIQKKTSLGILCLR